MLDKVSEKKAIKYDYFPTLWQAVLWRNWGYVPVERIAKVLNAEIKDVLCAAEEMGLSKNIKADAQWEKRGYLTIIRNNWHLCTYEQILTLLNITEAQLDFILKEDDFMWAKMGRLKPTTEKPVYAPLTEKEKKETENIRRLFREKYCHFADKTDNGFQFINNMEGVEYPRGNSEKLNLVYPYFALYGDAFLDETIDPLPDKLLKEYQKSGVNGVWMQAVLYQLVENPFDPLLSKGWDKRIENLRKMCVRAKKYGIDVYLYLNEPRGMNEEFFEKYPHIKGAQNGENFAMCTSTEEVKEYLYNSTKTLFTLAPELGGVFTITMSENLTNCVSRARGKETECPLCKKRKHWEIIAEVNNIIAKGVHDGKKDAKVIVWTWEWDEWADKAIELLNEGQIVQCNSEANKEFVIGGVKGNVRDYSMSVCGPSETAKRQWAVAKKRGFEISAKVQINNTWELAAIPYIPVFDKVEEHISNLKKEGVEHLQASWTLGGSPSPNMSLGAYLMSRKGTTETFLAEWLGKETGEKVNAAQKKLSEAFSEFPFHLQSLYCGPQNFGPMAPFFLEKTDYTATMVGFPYDDIELWRAIYTPEIFQTQYEKLCKTWKQGVEMLEECKDERVKDLLIMAKGALCHFESACHHVQFVNSRNKGEKEKMLKIVLDEIKTVENTINIRFEDSRIGYESSNHYFYTLQDLKEKLISLEYLKSILG